MAKEKKAGRRKGRRIWRRLLITLGIIFIVIPGMLYGLLEMSWVQTYLARQFAAYLSEKLHTRVEIEKVDIDFISQVNLEGVYVEDQQGDTLIWLQRLGATPSLLNLSARKIGIDRIELDRPTFYYLVDSSGVSNLQFLIDYFSSDQESKERENFRIQVDKTIIKQGRFSYRDEKGQQYSSPMNYGDLALTGIALEANNLDIDGLKILAEIEHLSSHEKCGFCLKHFSGHASFSESNIMVKNMTIQTDSTELKAKYYAMVYDSLSAFKDYVHKVKMLADFESSKVYSGDIAYFADALWGMNMSIEIEGKVSGTVSKLEGRDFQLAFGRESMFKGSFDLDGLPEPDMTFVQVNVDSLLLSIPDLETIPLPPYGEGKKLELPEQLNNIGTAYYQGELTGLLTDFVAYGTLKTDIGELTTDLGLNTAGKQTEFKGSAATNSLQLGKLMGLEQLGAVAMDIRLDGKASGQGFYMDIDGMVDSLEYLAYQYKNIELKGLLTDEKFDGTIDIDDPNLSMNFFGKVDFSANPSVFKLTANVRQVRPVALNLIENDSIIEASFILSADIKGSDPDEMTGQAELYEINYRQGQQWLSSNHLSMSATDSLGKRSLTISSDILDAELTGNYQFTALEYALGTVLKSQISTMSPDDEERPGTDQSFEYSLKLHRPGEILKIFIPELYVAPGTTANGSFDMGNAQMKNYIHCPRFGLDSIFMNELRLITSSEHDTLRVEARAEKLSLSPGIYLETLRLVNHLHADTASLQLIWENQDSLINRGDLSMAYFLKQNTEGGLSGLRFLFKESDIVLRDTLWHLSKSSINIDSSAIRVEDFQISSTSQVLNIKGTISESPSDTLELGFNNFLLSDINPLTQGSGLEFNGHINGNVKLANLYKLPVFFSDIIVSQFKVNGMSYGDLHVRTKKITEEQINLEAFTQYGKLKTLSISGDFNTMHRDINLVVDINKLYINLFMPFLDDFISSPMGYLLGTINVSGTLEEPILDGSLTTKRASFNLDFLNTNYKLESDKLISIRQNDIFFEELKIIDRDLNEALFTGRVFTNNFEEANLDIRISSDRIQALNTTESDNEQFYGTAYVEVLLKIQGPAEKINMDIIAKTLKGTNFNIPISSGQDVSDYSFIEFTSQDTTGQINMQKMGTVQKKSSFALNLELEATADARVQIIFDSKVGDVMSSTGSGDMLLAISDKGDFTMSGTYTIQSGEYLFTLQNAINKRFRLKPGGQINWSGDPYNARVELEAIYKAKASPGPLIMDSSYTYQKKYPVEAKMEMTGNLLSPEFDFGVAFVNNFPEINSQLASLSESEKQRQVISLMVLNSLQPLPGYGQGAQTASGNSGAVGANLSELLSNQFSHWLSQIHRDIDIGVNYVPGNELTTDELEVALSAQLLNNRVTIDYRNDVGGNRVNPATGTESQSSNDIVGDVSVEVSLHESGKLRAKAFHRSNEDILYDNSPYTQGIGIFYKDDFNSVGELMSKYWHIMTGSYDEYLREQSQSDTLPPDTAGTSAPGNKGKTNEEENQGPKE